MTMHVAKDAQICLKKHLHHTKVTTGYCSIQYADTQHHLEGIHICPAVLQEDLFLPLLEG